VFLICNHNNLDTAVKSRVNDEIYIDMPTDADRESFLQNYLIHKGKDYKDHSDQTDSNSQSQSKSININISDSGAKSVSCENLAKEKF